MILSIPDEGYSSNVPDEGYSKKRAVRIKFDSYVIIFFLLKYYTRITAQVIRVKQLRGYLSYIMVSFFCYGGKPANTTFISEVTDKLFHKMLSQLHLVPSGNM